MMSLRMWMMLSCAAFAMHAHAASPAEQLAVDTYKHLVSQESMLDGAVRSGDRNDFARFIWRPTSALIDKWPPMSVEGFDRFRRCQFAIIAFRTWSEDYFNAGGALPKTALSAKDYFEQKRQCKADLKGKI